MQPRLLPEPLRFAGSPLLRLQSDERLVRLVRAGSHPAFAEIVHRYRPGLVRYTDGLVGPARGEDVVQQGLAGAHTAIMADDRHITLKPWLFRIVHNAALNVLRADREIGALEDHTDELVTLSLEAEAASRERFRETLRAVQALPTAQRNALLLRELEGRSHEEIAAALGVTAGAARQHVMRARVTMRAAFTAITPFPFVLQLAAGGGAAAAGAPAVAGAGAGFGLVKAGAGVLAAGAIVGGAGVTVPAVLPGSGAGHAERAERRSGAAGGSVTPTPAGNVRAGAILGDDRGPAPAAVAEDLRAASSRPEAGETRARRTPGRTGRAGGPGDDEGDDRAGDGERDDRRGADDGARRDETSRRGTSGDQADEERSDRSASRDSGGGGSDRGPGANDSESGSDVDRDDGPGSDTSRWDPGSSGRDLDEAAREPSPQPLAIPVGSDGRRGSGEEVVAAESDADDVPGTP